MQSVCIDAKWTGKITLGKDILKYLKEKEIKNIALFASVQFLALDHVKEQLKKANIKVIATKAVRTDAQMQILGCDAYHDSFKKNTIQDTDAILYIGDGKFHPLALLHAQRMQKKIKGVILWDPIAKVMNRITEKDILKQTKKTKANIVRFLSATEIGILVTVKPGQQYLNTAKKLKEKLEKEGKKTYIFIDNTLDYAQFENYPFIEAWVNTACPRIGFDDILHIRKPLINIREAIEPVKALALLKH